MGLKRCALEDVRSHWAEWRDPMKPVADPDHPEPPLVKMATVVVGDRTGTLASRAWELECSLQEADRSTQPEVVGDARIGSAVVQ